MKYLFNDYMKFLKESKEEYEFSPDVYDFLSDLPYGKFETSELGDKVFRVDLDKIDRVGTYQLRIFAEGEQKISLSISLKSADVDQGVVTLAQSDIISTESSEYKKSIKKFINTTTKVVSDLKSL